MNKVAATDNFGGADPFLYDKQMEISRSGGPGTFSYSVNPGFEQVPIVWVTFVDAMRFVNWLENGQGFGGTESGAYTIDQGWNETREENTTYFMPSEDEWYKAAYHDPGAPAGYWKYPTLTNSPPIAEAPPGGPTSAGMASVNGGLIEVGSYPSATSPYGVFDLAGNVEELNESVIHTARVVRGGSWSAAVQGAAETERGNHRVYSGSTSFTGFRVARIPEPSAFFFLSLIGICAVCRARAGARDRS